MTAVSRYEVAACSGLLGSHREAYSSLLWLSVSRE
jgi:hypothetical protein